MKTSELSGTALDWAVAKAEGTAYAVWRFTTHHADGDFRYSTDWGQGGPIIEREGITIEWTGENWMGYIWHDEEFFGPTPLVVAMRCFVALILGHEVEIPQELLRQAA